MSLIAQLAQFTPDFGLCHLDDAIKGNAKAAAALCGCLNGPDRGHFAVQLGIKKLLRKSAYRAFLEMAWEHDHQHVLAAAHEDAAEHGFDVSQSIEDCFCYAAFKLPADLPDELTIYRGTFGLPVEYAEEGFSWTLSRKTGAWFANREPFRDIFPHEAYDKSHGPVLLMGKVSKGDILFYSNGREEREVVTTRVKDIEVIDPNEDNANG